MAKIEERIHLNTVLIAALALLFSILLIAFTEEQGLIWPILVIPVLITSYLFGLVGAVISVILVTAAAVLRVTFINEVFVEWRATAEFLAGAAAIAISGISVGLLASTTWKLKKEIDKLNPHDKVTGLYKADYLTNRLQMELERAERYQTSASLILLSIDDLEQYEETFGPVRTNQLLRRAAEVISLNVRRTDLRGVLGKNTIATLTPSDLNYAKTMAERIRKNIAETEFVGDEIEPIIKKTASLGIASYPNVTEADELIDTANQALSKASEDGGNKVTEIAVEETPDATETETESVGADK